MEADWEVEIGSDAPIMDAAWSGFVDLRIAPDRVGELEETCRLPGLTDALLKLNRTESQLWTSKCDVWTVREFDPDELDAPQEIAARAVGCYVDLLPNDSQQWADLNIAAQWCREHCARLRSLPMRCCRADLVVRRAFLSLEQPALGVTAYLTACGPSEEAANSQLQSALAVFVDSVLAAVAPDPAHQKLQ
jgi:hypothetical protein